MLTGDSFFHLAAYGDPLPGLNLCGAGRVVCLVDPIGDVYACPFAIHDAFLAGNVRSPGLRDGVARVRLFQDLAKSQTSGAALRRARSTTPAAAAAWLRSSSPGCRSTARDPECALGHGESLLDLLGDREVPRPAADHSRSKLSRPDWACDESPLAGFEVHTPRCGKLMAGGWFESVAEAQRR